MDRRDEEDGMESFKLRGNVRQARVSFLCKRDTNEVERIGYRVLVRTAQMGEHMQKS
jgi:hypothetical protein